MTSPHQGGERSRSPKSWNYQGWEKQGGWGKKGKQKGSGKGKRKQGSEKLPQTAERYASSGMILELDAGSSAAEFTAARSALDPIQPIAARDLARIQLGAVGLQLIRSDGASSRAIPPARWK